jgi:hypothetical protein
MKEVLLFAWWFFVEPLLICMELIVGLALVVRIGKLVANAMPDRWPTERRRWVRALTVLVTLGAVTWAVYVLDRLIAAEVEALLEGLGG